jgi:molybdopterin-guanine dinucleotide biosynthesis protein A
MMTAAPRIHAIVLAGGRSSRMGTDKALLPIGGKPLLRRICDALAEHCEGVTVVLPHGEPSRYDGVLAPGTRIAIDLEAGLGPLAGLHAGLSALPAGTDWAFVMACDMPVFAPELFRRMAAVLPVNLPHAAALPAVQPQPPALSDTDPPAAVLPGVQLPAVVLPGVQLPAAVLPDADPQEAALPDAEPQAAAVPDAGPSAKTQHPLAVLCPGQPFHAMYHRRAAEIAARLLDARQLKLMAWIDLLQPVYVAPPEDAHCFLNINTPEDYAAYQALFENSP